MAAGEIQLLPEPLIQQVQYFLTPKEAAQTAVLSKSWGSAWLTRPNLDFDSGIFSKLADKTLKRYEDSNLKIESFRLSTRDYPDQFRNLILRALKLGATRLYIITDCFDLPSEVLASENLVELTVEYCQGINLGDVRCSRLQSLTLKYNNGSITSCDALSRILSSCPLIEKLSLRSIRCLSGDLVLRRVRSLELDLVEFDTSGLASNFPSLKDLTLHVHIPYKEESQEDYIEDQMQEDRHIQEMLISSPSLERLHLKTDEYRCRFDKPKYRWRLKLDVPSIRKFTYEGESIYSLSFRSTSRAWESHVLIRHGKSLTTSWFRRLSKMFTKLRRSRIHLSLSLYSMRSYDYRFGDLQGLPTRVIENLTIDFHYLPSLNCFALLDGLFLTCRPKLITLKDNIDFVGQTLLRGLDVKYSNPNQFMYGLKDLEEAKAQLFDADVSVWRDVPLDAFQDKSITIPAHEYNRVVRFQLKWQS